MSIMINRLGAGWLPIHAFYSNAFLSGYQVIIFPMESDLPLKLAKPAQRALAQAGITRLEQLSRLSEAEVARLHGIGPHALVTLRRAMAEKGLGFAQES